MRLVGREEARVGEAVAYEIRVRNKGPDRAHDVRYWHRIPDGGTFVEATGGGKLEDGKVRWPTLERLKSGNAVFDTVWVRYDEPGRYENRAAVTAKTHDPHPGNNEDVEPTTVGETPVADTKVEKRGPATAQVGDTVRYVITTTNLGPDPADWVYVKDRLPEGSRFVDASRKHHRDGSVVEWDMIGILEPGESFHDTIWVAYPEPGTYVNRASISQITEDPNPDNDKATATTTVSGDGAGDGDGGADLEMRLVGRERAVVGETVAYELRVRNLGPKTAEDVRVRHVVPDGGTFVSATGGGSLEGGGVVVWPERGRLESGGQVYDTVRVRYDQPGRFVNRASVEADTPDPKPENNEASEQTTVGEVPLADLEVVKEGPATARPGDTIRYLITTRNLGPDLADWVYVTDHLPAGAVFVDASRRFTVEDGVVRWDMIGAIEPGKSVQDTVRVVLPEPGEYVNTASVTEVTEDPVPDNDDSTVTTVVSEGDGGGGRRADVDIGLDGPARSTAGETVSYSVRVQNHGPDQATGVRFRYRVPDGGVFVEASDGGSLNEDGWVRWPRIDRLARGSSVQATVRVRYDDEGRFRSRAVVESESTDPEPGNNSVTRFTDVEAAVPEQADLRIAKEGPATASPGDTVTFLVTTTNGGPDAARGVVVTDQLPEGSVLVSASRTLESTGPELRWEAIPVLEAGASVQDTVRLLLPEAGIYVNTAAVAAETDDPDEGNNGSSATVEVGGAIDVELTQSAVPTPFRQGEGGAFQLTVRNVGDSATTDTIRVESVIPAGVSYVSATSGDASWTFEYDAVDRGFTARRPGVLDPGEATAFQILVSVDVDETGPEEVTHVGQVFTAGDLNPANDVASVTVPVEAPVPPSILELTKVALVSEATIGDPVTYALTVRNGSAVPFTDVVVTDDLPDGFRLRSASVRLDGRTIGDPVVQVPTVELAVGRIEAGETRRLTYRAVVGSGTPIGRATNVAVARDRTTGVESSPGSATVDVQDRGVFTEEALIVGKVFAEIDSLRIGIPGVRVVLQDGTSAITDSEGNYNFVGLRPRLWVVRVDQSTLPAAMTLQPVTARHAGRGTSVFADLVRGEMHRVDFGAWETEGDSLWHLAVDDVMRRRRQAARAEADRGGGITWPILNGWMRDSTAMDAELGLPSAFGEVLPDWSINAGNSGLGPRPADPVAAGLVGERATWDGPLGLSAEGDVRTIADGERTVPIRVTLDRGSTATGDTLPEGSIMVTLEASRGRWDSPEHPDMDPVAPGLQIAVADGETVLLRAPSTPGDGTVRATALGRETTLVVPWIGDGQRPFLITGLVEGQVDGRSLETAELLAGRVRDRLQDPLEEITFDSDDGRYSGGLRAAAFATGDVGQETSLTLRFDTEKSRDRRFFEDIRPDDFYGVYGDASIKSFGAQSRGRVFGALTRGRSFLMYGDYLTGAGRREAQSLGRYARTLNGVAQHYEGAMGSVGLRVDAFASYDRTGQVVDELRGLGISGPYTLSRTDALINSEQVEILVRDRNQPSIILRRERLTRFLDYTVEPFTGRLLFKRPIPSIDDQLNPVSVRVVYEVEERGGDRFWVYGADGAFRVSDRVEVGAGLVRDENGPSGIDLSSANATIALTDHTFLFGELARSDSADVTGDAARVELRHASGRIDARAYYVETDSTFSNPSSGFGSGRREVGLRGRADLARRLQLLGEALRTESLLTGGEREGAQVALRYGEAWSVEAGYRYAEETTPASAETADVVPYDLNSLRARVTAPLPEGVRGAVFAEYEQDVNNGDQRRLVIGGDLRLFDRARLYGRHELISSFVGPYGLNPLQEQNNTVFGIAADYEAGTQVYSEYRARDAFEGREAHAAIGLRNQWAVADGLRLNTSFERRSPVGSGGEDALALTGALAYTANPLWKGTLRGEYRSAGDEDHVLGSLGYAGRLTEAWTLLGQSVFSHVLDGPTYERSRIGAAYRDIDTGRWNSLFRYEHRYDQEPREGLTWNRTAHIFSTHLDYRPADRLTLRAQYGAKHVTEEVSEEEDTSEPASLLGARIIYDLGARFDVGLTGWALRTGALLPAGGSFSLDDDDSSPQSRYAAGAELGWSPVDNLRIAGGYNAFGFIDDDFVPDQPTDHGFYLKVGYKIDRLWGDEPVWQDPPADVSVTKIGPETTVVERPTEYWMYPRNEGPDRARSVELQDVLPPGAQVLEASEGAVVVGDTIRWLLGNLEPGDGPPRYVQLAYPDTGVAVDEARIRASSPDPDASDNVASRPTRVAPYELRLEKTGPESAMPDEPVTYTITVTNLGPRPAESVVVRDSLPVGGVFESAGQDGGYDAGVVTWPSRPLAVGESATYSLTVRYPLAGRYRNVVRVNAPVEPDRASHAIEIGLPAEVRLTLFGSARALTGDTVLYRLHAYNEGPGTARNARVQLVVPPRGRVVVADSVATAFGGRVAWTFGQLAPGEDRVVELGVVFESIGHYRMEARAFSDFDDESETDRTAVDTRVFDWELQVQLTDSVLPAGRVVEYVLRTRNRGSGPAPFVVVEDSVAPGGSVEYASRGGTDTGDVVRWPELDGLAGGATQVDTVRIRYGEDGIYPNTAAASADLHTVKDRVESDVGLLADVRIYKLGPLLAVAGDTVQYALHVYNGGSGVARGVTVTDRVPVGAEVLSMTDGASVEGDSVLTWTPGDLEPGDEIFPGYTVRFQAPGLFLNEAVVATNADPDLRNDTARVATRVDDRPDLLPALRVVGAGRLPPDSLVVMATGPAVTRVGRSTEYEAFVTNRAPGSRADVRLTVRVPAGARIDSVSGGAVPAGDSVAWDLGTVGEGASAFGRFFLSFPTAGPQVVEAIVTAGTEDGLEVHADTVITYVVDGSPTLELEGPAAAQPGDTVTYVVTLGAEGEGPVSGVVVEDSIPAGATFVGASGGGTLQGRVVRWPPATLAGPDTVVTDTVRVTFGREGRYVNRVTTSPRFPGVRDEVVTVVGQAADVQIDLVGPASALVADTSLYYLHVYNQGNGVARAVEADFVLATGSRLVSATEGGVADEGGRVTWPVLESMEPGAELFPALEIAYDRPGTYRHRAAVASEFDPDVVNGSAELITRVLSRRLEVVLRGPVEASVRDSLAYVVETTYRGPGRIDDGYVEKTIPESATFLGASGGGIQTDGVVRWPLTGGLDSGVTRADTVRLAFPYGGRYTHVAFAAAGPLTGADTLTVGVEPLTDPTPSVVYFGFDLYNLNPRTRADLVQIAQQIRFMHSRVNIALVGHADTVGATDYNDRLGQRRADSVRIFLESLGVRSQRIEARTRGELDPVSTEGTRAAHARDRRVVLHYCDPEDPETRDRWPCNQFRTGGAQPLEGGAAADPVRSPPDQPARERDDGHEPRKPTP